MSKPAKSVQFHESFAREAEIEGSSDRSFGLVFAAFCAIIGLLPMLKDEPYYRLPWLIASAVFLVPALLFPKVLAPLNKLWLKFGLLLQKVVSPIILGLLFFVAITPIGLLMRVLGKDLLKLRWDKQASSYWIQRTPPGPPPETMSNQF